MDGAFLGLFLMLEKHARIGGFEIFVYGASRAQRALLRMNGMDFPAANLPIEKDVERLAAG